MKKILLFLLPVILLASCQPNYHNEISGNPFPAQQSRQGPIDKATLDSVSKGWVDTTLIHVENGPDGPVNIYSINDMIVTVKKTGYQNWNDFWNAPWRYITWFLGFIIMACSLIKFILVMNSGGAKGGAGDTSPMWWIGIMFIGAIMVATTTWPWSDEMSVPKSIFDNNQSASGDQHTLDWDHAQSY